MNLTNSELEKLDKIDREVLLWCLRHERKHIYHVVKMYQQDYRLKGVILNTDLLIQEIMTNEEPDKNL